jgi:glycerol 2-dehydrogenase (NADP+)
MEKLMATGKVKAIGVCNYSVPFLKELLAQATIVPAVNQIENHPSLPQQEVVDFCKEKDIHITAYSPLGSTGGPMMKASYFSLLILPYLKRWGRTESLPRKTPGGVSS